MLVIRGNQDLRGVLKGINELLSYFYCYNYFTLQLKCGSIVVNSTITDIDLGEDDNSVTEAVDVDAVVESLEKQVRFQIVPTSYGYHVSVGINLGGW